MKNIRTTYPITGSWDTRKGGRVENQDSCGFIDTPYGFMAIVCDGMGGGPAGRQASELAVKTIVEFVNHASQVSDVKEMMQQAIEQAHQEIVSQGAKHPELQGMGSTVVAVLFHESSAIIAHVGDSRVYQLRYGSKIFRTDDHSMVAELVRDKRLTEEQARLSGQSNLITRALGGGKHLADIDVRPYEKGDRFMLCTDGVWGALPEKELIRRAAKTPSLAGAVDSIVLYVDELGRQNGDTHDNLTLALFETKRDSNLKEKMSRKVLHFIIGLVVAFLISLTVIVVLLMKLTAPNPYEQQVKKLNDSIIQKDKIINELKDSVLKEKHKVADAINKAAEEKTKIAKERQEAAEKAQREDEIAKKQAEDVKAKTAVTPAKPAGVSNLSEIQTLRKKIKNKLEDFKKEKNDTKRQKLITDVRNDLNVIKSKDPSNKSIYDNVRNKLNSTTYTGNSTKVEELINMLEQIK